MGSRYGAPLTVTPNISGRVGGPAVRYPTVVDWRTGEPVVWQEMPASRFAGRPQYKYTNALGLPVSYADAPEGATVWQNVATGRPAGWEGNLYSLTPEERRQVEADNWLTYQYLNGLKGREAQDARQAGGMEMLNAVTGGTLNLLSPSQIVGDVRNLYNYTVNPVDDNLREFSDGLIYGNTGLVNRGYAESHPVAALALNTAADLAGMGALGATRQGMRELAGDAGRAARRTAIKSSYALGVKPGASVRAAETLMRTSGAPNPLPEIWKGFWGSSQQRKGAVAKYIATGKSTGPKGYYNSFASNPDHYYAGFMDRPVGWDGADLIDAALYGKTIDPKTGLVRGGKTSSVFDDYIAQKYPERAEQIQYYTVSNPVYARVADQDVVKSYDWRSQNIDRGLFTPAEGMTPNVAGHQAQTGLTIGGKPVYRGADIWKFDPDDYRAKWLNNNEPVQIDRLKVPAKIWKPSLYWGLKRVNNRATPIVIQTPWVAP